MPGARASRPISRARRKPSSVHAEYAKRPPAPRPPGPMDAHGRAAPRAEDDQLEIPAFLRRQPIELKRRRQAIEKPALEAGFCLDKALAIDEGLVS